MCLYILNVTHGLKCKETTQKLNQKSFLFFPPQWLHHGVCLFDRQSAAEQKSLW